MAIKILIFNLNVSYIKENNVTIICLLCPITNALYTHYTNLIMKVNISNVDCI